MVNVFSVIFVSTLILNTCTQVCPADILFYFTRITRSHKIAVWPLAEELANKGHKITFLSAHPEYIPPSHPGIFEFVPKNLSLFYEKVPQLTLDRRLNGRYRELWDEIPKSTETVCEVILKSQEIQEWVKTAQFDLIIIDAFYHECGLGFAYKFKAKVILFSPHTPTMWMGDIIGNVPETSWIPDLQYHQLQPMTFFERVYNTLLPIYWHLWVRRFNLLPNIERMLREELGIPDMPPIPVLENDIGVIFTTYHSSIEYARSLPPVYIPVGGIHIVGKPNEIDLPKDIEKFLDESGQEGAIFVSFGSFVQLSKLPDEIRTTFYKVFGSFKTTRFVWKFDLDRPKDLPGNIMTVKWAPQQDILAHKNVKGFISHAGFLSIQEAVYYGVPLIVFPLYAEQDFIANNVQDKGFGIKLELRGVTEQQVHDAIFKILTIDSYKSRMAGVSKLFKDGQSKPLDTAVWWTEYVLRHNDTSFLKPLSRHQFWFERRLLDVWLFLFSFALFLIVGFIYIVLKICLQTEVRPTERHKPKRS